MSKKKPQEERVREILEAALRCFARKGYDKTTMDDIVEESGLTKGGIYWYFKSKRDIFTALLDWHAADDLKRWNILLNNEKHMRTLLCEYGTTNIREHLDNPWLIPLFSVMMSEAFRDKAVRDRMVTMIWEQGIDSFAGILKKSEDIRETNPRRLKSLSAGLMAFSFGLLMLTYLDREKLDYRKTWTDFIGFLFDGIGKKDFSSKE